MPFQRRTALLGAMLAGVAMPAYAENPPRPDGLLYLILIIPLLAVASRFAGLEKQRRSWPWRIVFGVVFALLVFLSAAGTGIGILAVLVIVVYGILRSLRIMTRGVGRKRVVWGAVALLGSLLVGVGYMWALAGGSAYERHRAGQLRTVSDMRTIGTAIMMWSEDQRAAREAGVEGDAATATVSSAPAAAPATEDIVATASFAAGQGPPAISAEQLAELLVPDYLKIFPEMDGFKRPFDIRFDSGTHELRIRSGGRDRRFDSDVYTRGPYDRWQWDKDIVWVDGEFFSWPELRRR